MRKFPTKIGLEEFQEFQEFQGFQEFQEDGGRRCEGREVREGERSMDMGEWVLGFGSKVDMGK